MKKQPIVFYNVLTYYSYFESTKLYDSCSAQGNSYAKTKEIVRSEIQKPPNKYPSSIRFGTFLTFYGKTFFLFMLTHFFSSLYVLWAIKQNIEFLPAAGPSN